MTEKAKSSTYRPLAERGDFMKWYEFECVFCGYKHDLGFSSDAARDLAFWNPVHCQNPLCNKWSTPERKNILTDEKKKAQAKRERIKANMEAREGLFDSVIGQCLLNPRQTILSPDRAYRYQLWREWPSGEGYALFIGLNPSTADEIDDDNTIRKCIKYAKKFGYQALCMANLFAFRATQPKDMLAASDPIGEDNDRHLMDLAEGAGVIIAAWGAHGSHRGRDRQVMDLIQKPMCCLGLTADGLPRHPLYMRDDQELVSFK